MDFAKYGALWKGLIHWDSNPHTGGREVTEQYSKTVIDGGEMEFLLALGTEAPSEMFVYLPWEKPLCIAEDCNATIHNMLTPRGAKVRHAVAGARSIQSAIDLWGDNLTSVFGVHNWPPFGNRECIEYI